MAYVTVMNYVYLLKCADNTLYCGWTTDLSERLKAHNSGQGAKYTRARLPVELVYREAYEDRREAMRREWEIKQLRREQKLALIGEGREVVGRGPITHSPITQSRPRRKKRVDTKRSLCRDREGLSGTMQIRRAEKKDIEGVLRLLSQVLELHAAIRPDIFVPGTTKYMADELEEKFRNDLLPVYVAVDAKDRVMGYAFCAIKEQPFSNNMVPFTSVYIDDLCVDAACRGQHIGEKLFEHVKEEARKLGCYELTLNVWEGNDGAMGFYERMGMKVKSKTLEFIL